MHNAETDVVDQDFAKFLKWYEDFIERNGGYAPKDLKSWFDKVIFKHQDVIKFIGGQKIQKFYTIDAQDLSSENKEIDVLGQRLVELLPSFLIDNGYDKSIFYKQMVPTDSHNAIKLTKIISNYAASRLPRDFHSEVMIKQKQERINKIISDLGKQWQKSKTTKIELEITLSCTPNAFCLLGHYGGSEPSSCFRQASSKTQHKYALGQSRNTVVITIGAKKDNAISNIARWIGYLDIENKRLNLINLYFKPQYQEADLIQVAKLLYKDLFKVENVVVEENRNRLTSGIHLNKYGNISIHDANESMRDQIWDINALDIMEIICPNCHTRHNLPTEFFEVDNIRVCHNCSINAHICDITGRKTFLELTEFIANDSIMHGILEEVQKICHSCKSCEKYILKNYMVDGMCLTCREEHFSSCDGCETEAEDEKIQEIFGYHLCPTCVEKRNFPFTPQEDELLNEILATAATGKVLQADRK